ncbi:hypothetical protein [Pseudoalteromonas luteoviolacea]|uniref:Uncharacterized protein n=1 Tax=Pseudoalteromonas luteoviolacea H33 TaxID=1365251 RepID=A0A167A7H2_9GAMM|nr:hypothetical protein [Pseudoalteromonas luteoviolacea]KZN45068.1 hypothetical protein N476_25790 [Pseudoalteromonas luteoviolacea H33]KZN79258.1 hypothetical protein N477_00225 [Pseudoalteromonas luteoviolacea H33-S]MBQ4877899.1 hypothetical protein [Pseudoalteromonas luteoviolacea]MBQ4906934.1 hypothetical protein [Pseudoalteromonas luteoviolacea]
MDFYILKKQEKLVAIPADEQNCKAYIEDGYCYVDKVAACNERAAIKRLEAKQSKLYRAPMLLLLALPLLIFAWWRLSY